MIDSGGSITGRVTNITTTGNGADGALLRAVDTIVFTSDGAITTTGDNAPAIDAQGRSVTVNANVLRTAGDNSTAAQLTSLNGPTSLNAGLIQTDGNLSRGAVLFGNGTTSLTGGGIQTNGANAGAFAISNDAAACIVLGNGGCDKTVTLDNVSTNGFGSVGGLVTGAGRTNVAINALQTNGTDAAGLNIATDPTACIALGAGSCGSAFTINNLTTQGARSPGAVVNGGGPISANVGVLRTGGDQAAGLNLASDPTACAVLGAGQCGTSFTVGQLTTSGAGSTGALIRSAGPTSGNVGVLRTSGANAAGIDIASNPTTCVIAGAGACDVGLNANDVATSGDGAAGVLIQPAGNVTTTIGQLATTGNGSTGLGITQNPTTCLAIGPGACRTNATVGSASTRGANARALSINGANGPVVLNAGSVTTSGPNSDGVNVLTTTGNQTITAGPLTVTGAGSNGIVAVATGCGQLDITATAPIISAQGTAILASSACGVRIATLPGAAVAGRLAGINVASGTGSTITVGDAVSSATGPAINADGAPALVTITPTGTVNGFVDLTAGDDQLINNGTFNATGDSAFGAGNDSFVNAGRFAVRPAATTAGAVGLSGLETFANSGLVDLRNGVAGDTLTLPGIFSGTGASTLGLDVSVGAAGASSDKLVISGAATGNTTIVPNQLQANPGVLVNNFVLVDAGAGSSATAFTLGTVAVPQGLVRYGVAFNPASNDYALFGTPNTQAYELGMITAGARQLFYRTNDAAAGHMQSLRDGGTASAGDTPRRSSALWGQMYGSADRSRSRQTVSAFGQAQTISLDNTQDFFGAQIGYDFGSVTGRNGFVFGVTGGYANSTLGFRANADRLDYQAVNGGVYASVNAGPFFLNALAKYEHYFIDVVTPSAGIRQNLNGNAYGGMAEAGARLGTTGFFIEPSASIEYVRTNIDTLTAGPSMLDPERATGLRGKAGARLGTEMISGLVRTTLYVSGNVVHEFRGRDHTLFTSGGQSVNLGDQRLGTYGRGTVGFNIVSNEHVSGFVEAYGDVSKAYKGGGGRAGLSVRF